MINFSTFASRSVKMALSLSVLGATMASHAAPANLVQNGSFEQSGPTFPSAVNSSYCYTLASVGQDCGPVAAWTGSFQLLAANSGPWNTPTSLAHAELIDGQVVAGIQNNSALAQDITLGGGSYTLSWADANRGSYDNFQSYQVFLGALSLGTFTTDQTQGWSSRSVSVNVAAAGAQTLSFVGLQTTGDHTAFIDHVSLTSAVPEPESIALALAGLAVVGSLSRRRSTQG